MKIVKDLKWKKGINVNELVNSLGNVGFQSIELEKAKETIIKMKKDGCKIYLTYTSNMVTSGLRGFFAQIIKLGLVDVVVTTVGGIEEDIMKAHKEEFVIGDFNSDDVELYEKGVNRVGNLFIRSESYAKFEDLMRPYLKELYSIKKRWTPSEIFLEIGKTLEDEDSILFQAAKKNVPIFCPAVTDGSFGFHLFMFQQDHEDFIVDVVKDFQNILFSTSQDEKKGLISLGGSISKHHAILACLLNGGIDYAVYMTTARYSSGSMSGATTNEAKSWGKIKDDSDAVTVIGDASINFPLVMISVLEELDKEGML
ncbi:deoxyhypusine synthase family protein [Candidatus Woesearchaeota archaeon]|jgi:deoxyhypusine synthase|nr:deoxyhypusine synthase family protein [Candidatus Woesearchaeota archaeon]MBT4835018.1 deoxyhypusine synthase family protein [Candidatus Woesearchaeota archaeon]MBT6735363.1 deoxyhypusine synthase family protein [Candidatus Woesearchaeota archaeon]MBT7169697.1 deoxyhypusine synthase family protein [Candidatus Woesearchaeota archaeon]MBT7474808.1 deoxyhypusine synthase family protein [Candidatus Woesearchaeota archaeon]